jgi:hypothetical protein
MTRLRRPGAGTLTGIAVVVVLVAACALTYQHFAARMPDLNYRTLAASGEEGRAARDGLVPADFGDSDGYDYVRTFDQVVGMKFLSDKEIATFKEGLPSAARATVASTPRGRVVAVVVKMATPQAAKDTAAKLDQLQLDAGMLRAPSVPFVRRVELQPAPGTDQLPDGRIHYAHGPLLVRVDLTPTPGTDLGPAFTELVDRQLRELPADG